MDVEGADGSSCSSLLVLGKIDASVFVGRALFMFVVLECKTW